MNGEELTSDFKIKLFVVSQSGIPDATKHTMLLSKSNSAQIKAVLFDANSKMTLHEFVKWQQNNLGLTRLQTVVVGASVSDFDAASDCLIYFHVGNECDLNRRVPNLVPLWGQLEIGLKNIIQYFIARNWADNPLTHQQMIDFVYRAGQFYARSDAPARVLHQHDAFCAGLRERFRKEVAAIFATGYPFYCPGIPSSPDRARTPSSIHRYLRQQLTYFRSRLIRSVEDTSLCYEQLAVRNKYDLYEYSSRGFKPPPLLHGADVSANDLMSSGLLAEPQDIWPCDYCVPLQARDLFLDQLEEKDTNKSCLRCRQTPLMLRNIMTCSVDFDVVVVVRDRTPSLIRDIKNYVMQESTSYLYDLALRRLTHNVEDGPVDLFVAGQDDVLKALSSIAGPRWLQTGFDSAACWSTTLDPHFFNLGEDFALTFVPRGDMDAAIRDSLASARRAFALAYTSTDVINALSNHSLGHSEIVSNPEVAAHIHSRMQKWRRGEELYS